MPGRRGAVAVGLLFAVLSACGGGSPAASSSAASSETTSGTASAAPPASSGTSSPTAATVSSAATPRPGASLTPDQWALAKASAVLGHGDFSAHVEQDIVLNYGSPTRTLAATIVADVAGDDVRATITYHGLIPETVDIVRVGAKAWLRRGSAGAWKPWTNPVGRALGLIDIVAGVGRLPYDLVDTADSGTTFHFRSATERSSARVAFVLGVLPKDAPRFPVLDPVELWVRSDGTLLRVIAQLARDEHFTMDPGAIDGTYVATLSGVGTAITVTPPPGASPAP
jgi:hypothetical protein